MNNKIIKAISIFAVALLGVSLSACGNKNDSDQTEEKDKYVYSASFEKIKFDDQEGSPSAYSLTEDKLYALYYLYNDDTFEAEGIKFYTKDLKTGEVESKLFEDISLNGYINQIKVLKDGTIKVAGYEYMENGSSVYIYTLSKEGKLLDSFNVTEEIAKTGKTVDYFQGVKFTDDGKVFVSSDYDVFVFDNGKIVFNDSVQSWIRNLFIADGKGYITTYDAEGYSTVVKEIDIANKCFAGEYKNIGDDAEAVEGENGHLIAASSNAVYDYDLSTQEKTLLWKWLDLDISNYDINNFVSCGNDTYKMFFVDWTDDSVSMELATFTKGLASNTEKKVITYGCFYLDYYIKQDILKFNKTNPDYRISVIEYQDEASEYQAALDKYKMDANSGKFDIIDVSYLDQSNTASKGLYKDLYEFINKDAEIDLKDYNEKVIRAFETDGKLYSIAPNFTLSTIVTSKKVGESIKEWNTEALIKLRDQYKDKDFISYPNKDSAFYSFVYASIRSFIDSENGKCNFDCDEFIDLLEYANSFPDGEVDYGEYDEWGKIKSGDIILDQLYISSVESLSIYSQLFEGGLYVLGYPTKDGGQSFLAANSLLAIAEKSQNADGAWQFIKYLLSEESQSRRNYNGFPILNSAFNDIIKEEMTVETYIDENGVKQKQSKGSWGNQFTTLEYYGATEEDVEQLEKALDGLTVETSSDEQVLSILMEELDAYFKGQKTAKEVAGLIQNRVTIYLAEQN